MIINLLRSLFALLAGLAVALVLVLGVELLSGLVHPFPPGVDPTDLEACRAHVARYPGWVLGVVVVLWGLTTFLSSWTATRLGTGQHPAHGLLIGGFLLAMVILNMSMLPYPGWFVIANLLIFPLSSYWGAHRGRPAAASRNRSATSPLSS